MARHNSTITRSKPNHSAPVRPPPPPSHSTSESALSPAPPTSKRKRLGDNASSQRATKKANHSESHTGHSNPPDDSSSSSSDEAQVFERASDQQEPRYGGNHRSNVNSHAAAGEEDEEEEEDGEEEAQQRHNATETAINEQHGHKFLTLVAEMSRRSAKNSSRDPLKQYTKAARYIPRAIGPFENIAQAFQIGLRMDEADDGDLDDGILGLDPDARMRAKSVYDSILTITPGLSNKIRALEDDLDAVTALIEFFDHNQQSARTDDVSSMKTHILDFLPDLDPELNITKPSSKTPKEQRGFHHHATGRLLCPRILRDEFDKDMAKFCRKVRNCEIDIEADDYPSFLYPEDKYNPDQLDEHLLRSDFLVQCFRCLFLGPSKAKGNSGSNGGRPSIAKIYNITNITPVMIAYVVVLARFALSSSPRWDEHDGNFSLAEFFDNIVDLFSDKEWSTATLEWWNIQVLGTKSTSAAAQASKKGSRLTAVELLARQRRAT